MMDAQFGDILRYWRQQRRMSQLDLGLAADVSARHISFLETGRAKPSKTMVVLLSEWLEIPRVERNSLLNAAGYAPAYRQRDLSEADMASVRSAIEWTLERHDPFPGMALDRYWNILVTNQAATRLLTPLNVGEGDNLIDLFIDNDRIEDIIVNIDEVVHHLIVRLRTESNHLGGDDLLEKAIKDLKAKWQINGPPVMDKLPAVVPTRYRIGSMELSFISTIAQFGTAEDITLADLKVELMFPADSLTKGVLLGTYAELAPG